MDDDTLEHDVRAALEPEADAVDRVVQGALSPHHRRRSGRRRVLATAGATALLIVGVLVLTRGTRMNDPTPTRLTNIGNTIVVKPASGGVWLVGGDGRKDARLPEGTIVVYRPGDTR